MFMLLGLPKRLSERLRKIEPSLLKQLLHLLKVTFLSSSLYLVMLFFWFHAGQDIVTTDETGYLAWASAWATGDYTISRLYGDRIVFLFIVSVFFRLFGSSLEVGRWVVHLFGICLLVTTYYIGKEVYSKRVGFLAMLILMFSGFFMFLTYYALTDIPSAFFFTATFFFFLKAFKYKSAKYSVLGGLFCMIGPFTKVSYIAVFPIVGIIGLQRLARKEINFREALRLIGYVLIAPLSVIAVVFFTFRSFFMRALQRGLVLFGEESLTMEAFRERVASLLGHEKQINSFTYLIRTLLFHNIDDRSFYGALRYLVENIIFPGPFSDPYEAIYRYYEIERWILLVVFLLSLLYRRTRSFDMLAWIATYGFIWLFLTPAMGRIHIAEVSDRYLYPLIPAIYIQFASLIFLFLDKLSALQGGLSSFDHAIRAFKKKKLFVPPIAVLLVLAVWPIGNLNILLIGEAISVLVFLKVSKEREKGRLTFILASLAIIFLFMSNYAMQVRFANTFVYSSPIQEESFGIPSDLLAHEEIGSFEEGIWAKMSYTHQVPILFTERQFKEDLTHSPGNFWGLYIWFSSDRARDRVVMYVRWMTDDFSESTKFSGYFQGINVKFSYVSLIDCEDDENVQFEGDTYLQFKGKVRGDDYDGFNLILEFVPSQSHYLLDWDLFHPRRQDLQDHVFLGKMPLAMLGGSGYPPPPHRITFSAYGFHLKWRGLNRLADQPLLLNMSYQGLYPYQLQRTNWTDDYHAIEPLRTNSGTELPAGDYMLWGIFSEVLKEVELVFVHGSGLKHRLEMDILINWNQTDPNYMHIGLNRRDLPLKIDFYSNEDLKEWSVSHGPSSFFGKFPIVSWTIYRLLVLIWLISIVLISAPEKLLSKRRIALNLKKPGLSGFFSALALSIAKKLRKNQLLAYFLWLVIGPLSLSIIFISTHEPPFWWDPIAHDYFETFQLSYHWPLFFWFVFEELILVGTLVLGAWFLLSELAKIINSETRSVRLRKTHMKPNLLETAVTVGLKNVHDLVKTNPPKVPIMERQVTAIKLRTKTRTFLMILTAKAKGLFVRVRNRMSVPSRPNKRTLEQIKKAGKALIFTVLIISTFFLVMGNNARYLNQITKGQDYHESLYKAYVFLNGHADEDDRIMVHNVNWGKWYTKNKFTFIGMNHDWSMNDIWGSIKKRDVKFVIISEWEEFHPFEGFETSKYAKNFIILWSFAGTVGFRTTVYEVVNR